MRGHENIKTLVRDYLKVWLPLRLELLRQGLEVDLPVDPTSYSLADNLPQNDPSMYPAVLVMSTRTVGMTRRKATSAGDLAEFDVDYEVVVVVAAEHDEYGDSESAALHRDRLLLAVRECLLLPAALDTDTAILTSPLPVEVTGAAAETLRGQALAAGQITFQVRSVETLLPTTALASILDRQVEVTAFDASQSIPTQ
jgi:hypothetical protein